MKRAALCCAMVICPTMIVAQNEQQDSDMQTAVHAMCDAAAPKLRESGTNQVVLMMALDNEGRVRSFKTEFPKGVQLEKMKDTVAAIKRIKFTPAKKDGSPFAVQIRTAFKCDVSKGIVGDIPGGLPANGANVKGGILSSEPQSPGAGASTHVRVSQGVMRNFLITKVNPSYPPEAERQRVDGAVLLRIDIDKTGNVSRVDAISGHPLLVPAAIDAVKQWKYKPYLLNQEPVEVETTVQIKFVISGGNAYSVIALTAANTSSWC